MNFRKVFEQYLAFVKRFIPEPMIRSSVGIDIGLTSCKMVEVRHRGNTIELVRWGIEPCNGSPEQAVKKILERAGQQTVSPSTAVHGKGTLIRYVELPRMSPEELKKSFSYEADKYLPFNADQIYLDCLILDPKSKRTKMTVMIAAAKKEIINERIELFKKIGLTPDFISLNPIAMANVINTLGIDGNEPDKVGESKEALAIVDIGEKVTNINIIYGGLPRFTRDIFTAGADFTKQISNVLKVSMEEAESLKCNPGSRKDEVVKVCESVALNLISDMRLSLDYFVTENNVPVKKILLAGGMSLFDGMTSLFNNYLEIDVVQWDPFEHVAVPVGMKEEIKKVSSQLGAALGLALY
ncbi:MAG: type IV pilus assembly protein PilM [Candidatus Omnitrophota bacterium]